ncbi:Phage protein [Streptococcus phage V22]|uniref:Phage protein n=2 Tax=root TaxID=1 RepID=E8ZD48_9CAUD|nr:Phage protein [Streptococcus phage V22]
MFSTQPIFNEIPIIEEVKVVLGVEASMGRIYPETLIHLDISGYGNRVHSVHRFPGVFLTVGESIQLKILFYKRLRNFTADRFLTFRESDWKFFIRDLVNEFVR